MKTESNKVTSVNACIDWVSVTVNEPLDRELVGIRMARELDLLISSGHKPRVWRGHGYEGWVCDCLKYGEREQDITVSCWSNYAHLLFPGLMHHKSNVSRLDLAVTVWFEDEDHKLAENAWGRVMRGLNGIKGRRDYQIIKTLLGSDTLYVGRRASAQYGRVYNKGHQSAEALFAKSWRYEVEYKGRMAARVAEEVKANKSNPEWIAQIVSTWFGTRGVTLPEIGTNPVNEIGLPTRSSDADKTIQWLEKQVRPALARLARLGREGEALDALGLNYIESKE